MHITLAYGKTGLPLELDDSLDVTVVEPTYVPRSRDPAAAVRRALASPLGSPPLGDLVRPGHARRRRLQRHHPARRRIRCSSRPSSRSSTPRSRASRSSSSTRLGTHRPNTEAELRGMVGDAIFERRRIVQNDAFDPADPGPRRHRPRRATRSGSTPSSWRCDLKILTGFIEPHLFAGFSGGGKAIMPGMAGQRTVLGNHDAGMVGHPEGHLGRHPRQPHLGGDARGRRPGGPPLPPQRHSQPRQGRDRRLRRRPRRAHAAGCAFVKRTAMVARAPAVRHRGHHQLRLPARHQPLPVGQGHARGRPDRPRRAARSSSPRAAPDGIPEHGLYGKILRESRTPRELLDRICAPGFLEQDQWQAQIQALVQQKAAVYVRSDGLTDDEIRAALLLPCRRIEDTIAELLETLRPRRLDLCHARRTADHPLRRLRPSPPPRGRRMEIPRRTE